MRRRELDIQLKSPEQIELMRGGRSGRRGRRWTRCVTPSPRASPPPIWTPSPRQVIRDAGAVPSFKGYHGFPASICASVNEQVVHGIPGRRAGAAWRATCSRWTAARSCDGWHGDSAITVGVGETDPGAAEDGRGGRGRHVGRASPPPRGASRTAVAGSPTSRFNVEKAVRKAGRYGIVDGYGGHGIGTEMHQDPHVLNHGKPGKGPQAGASAWRSPSSR